MSERCERTNKQTSEWRSTYIAILDCSEHRWSGVAGVDWWSGRILFLLYFASQEVLVFCDWASFR